MICKLEEQWTSSRYCSCVFVQLLFLQVAYRTCISSILSLGGPSAPSPPSGCSPSVVLLLLFLTPSSYFGRKFCSRAPACLLARLLCSLKACCFNVLRSRVAPFRSRAPACLLAWQSCSRSRFASPRFAPVSLMLARSKHVMRSWSRSRAEPGTSSSRSLSEAKMLTLSVLACLQLQQLHAG